MYAYPNPKISDRRGKPLAVGDWEHPDEKGSIPYHHAPTLRVALMHFLERLPLIAVEAGPGGARPVLRLEDFRLRDKLLDVLGKNEDAAEPENIHFEDAHRGALVRWFEAWGAAVFGPDVVAVDTALDAGKLAKPVALSKPA